VGPYWYRTRYRLRVLGCPRWLVYPETFPDPVFGSGSHGLGLDPFWGEPLPYALTSPTSLSTASLPVIPMCALTHEMFVVEPGYVNARTMRVKVSNGNSVRKFTSETCMQHD